MWILLLYKADAHAVALIKSTTTCLPHIFIFCKDKHLIVLTNYQISINKLNHNHTNILNKLLIVVVVNNYHQINKICSMLSHVTKQLFYFKYD